MLSRLVRRFRLLFVLSAVLLPVACGESQAPTTPTPSPQPSAPSNPPPVPPPPPVVYADEVFVGAGDVADCNNDGAQRTARQLDGLPGTVFMLGDGAYPNGSEENYADCYDPYWGRHLSRTRPVAGNHDYDEPAARAFLNFFAGRLGDTGQTYYSFRLGAWAIYALDSNIPADEASAQYRWLAAELAANPSACTLAYWHHPVRSSSRGGDNDQMLPAWRLLAANRADVVLSGHDHVYERFAPMSQSLGFDANGIRQFVAGMGGSRLYTFNEIKPLSEVRIAAWGVLKLVLKNDGYTWDFLPARSGNESDSGDAACSALSGAAPAAHMN